MPKKFVQEVIIPETNKYLKEPLTYGEFLRWFGMWLLMATTRCDNRRDFWSSKPVDVRRSLPDVRIHVTQLL